MGSSGIVELRWNFESANKSGRLDSIDCHDRPAQEAN